MPRLIDPGEGDAIDVADLVDALSETDIDVRDEDAFASLGPLLARLDRNRGFLADRAIAELKTRHRSQMRGDGYGAQVLLLHPPDGRFVLRANFWPARDDAVVRASGLLPFAYDLPHDHNFPFLTVGHLGPGYWSDYYDYAVDAVDGVPGEAAGLRFVERARLEPQRLMLYRMRRDVHVQLPPDRFSVSLNILGFDAAQPWLDQYRFDTGTNTIAQGMTVTPAEALVTLASRFGGGNGRDLAETFAARHPCDRMRVTAMSACADDSDGPTLLERMAGDPNRYVAAHARRRLALIQGKHRNGRG